ncbi:DegT/DnrJ/EryC1/StrS aminotransferase family protein [Caulobacter sp. S45]|uniref:DegT/DnrJ/EryC1/StrS family aminotransferase n=1 Tax=Caulobacter sp. S45 TaxID=1641861 RepID=UPI0020C6ADB9|nr:DegT/DnrJ/EryC1/StrS aminotransferase family protein [Caulobacter sp. S45]
MNAPSTPIAFIDLLAQRRRLGDRIDRAVMGAVDAGQWIMGPQVVEFERRLAAFGRAEHALSCANGTDALALPLMAWEIGAGQAVFCPSFTFTATAEAVCWTGATPVFVDILPETYNLDAGALERAVQAILAEGRLKPAAVIAVDLFGQPADYPALAETCARHGLKLVADSAQGFGCTLGGEHPLHWADVTTTSFFPAKPLGCYGDGGAVLTDDARLAELIDSIRVHGKAIASDAVAASFAHEAKYLNTRVGMNSRLDTLQAAILLEKLDIFPDDMLSRNAAADRYAAGLEGVSKPAVIAGGVSTWAQYTVEVDGRDEAVRRLKSLGVPTAVYYPVPLHQQVAYADCPVPGGLPVTEAKASRVLSLPISADLEPDVQDYVIQSVCQVTADLRGSAPSSLTAARSGAAVG